jgi:hypothetical protein
MYRLQAQDRAAAIADGGVADTYVTHLHGAKVRQWAGWVRSINRDDSGAVFVTAFGRDPYAPSTPIPTYDQGTEDATPPPDQETEDATPPPDQETEDATPDPDQEMTDATPDPDQELADATPGPDQEMTDATPDPDQEMTDATPDPDQELDDATPDPDQEMTDATPDPDQEMTDATPDPDQELADATPDPDQEMTDATPDPDQETGDGTPAPDQETDGTPGPDLETDAIWPGYVSLYDLPADQIAGLQVGQAVQFDGVLDDIGVGLGMDVRVEQAGLTRVAPILPALPTAGPVTRPAATLPPAAPTTATPDSLPPFATVAALQDRSGAIGQPTVTALLGKRVAGWEGWVVDSERADQAPYTTTLIIAMDDPYTTTLRAVPQPGEADSTAQPAPLVALDLAPSATAVSGRPGQQIRFSGRVDDVEAGFGLAISLSDGRVDAAADTVVTPPAPPDLADLKITLDHSGGVAPAHTLTLYGTGLVVWQGQSYVRVAGTRFALLPPATLRQLLADVDRAGFWTLDDSYEDEQAGDMADTDLTIEQGKQAKTVSHYDGDSTGPAKLTILENQIEQLIGTAQWIAEKP